MHSASNSESVSKNSDSDRRIDGSADSDTLGGGQGNDSLFGGPGHDFYIYSPGDGHKYIDDESGLDTLVLQQIHSTEITVNRREDGFLIVNYKGQSIVEMRGVDLIQTTDGCYRIEDWLDR